MALRKIKVQRVVTFEIDPEAWALEYGLEPTRDAVRRDFVSVIDEPGNFDEPSAWSAAWPGLVTSITIRER